MKTTITNVVMIMVMIKIYGDLVHDDYKDDNNEGDEHNDNGE